MGPIPLHMAIIASSYENTVLLLKECQENCPETLTATWNGVQFSHLINHAFFVYLFCSFSFSFSTLSTGNTLLHLAASRPERGPIIKYLLREYKDITIPMLLAKDNRDDIPLNNAESVKVSDAPIYPFVTCLPTTFVADRCRVVIVQCKIFCTENYFSWSAV